MDEEQKSEYITQLLAKESLSEQEMEWLVQHETDLKFELEQEFILHAQSFQAPSQAALERNAQIKRYLLNLQQQPAPVRKMPFRHSRWIQYAACVILLLGIGIYYYLAGKEDIPTNVKIRRSDRAPGGNKAVLVLANGRTLVLDSLNQGLLAVEGSSEILKSAAGEITYRDRGLKATSTQLNTLRTPMGGQYQLQLPDGSRVWLNAASSIEYPVAFTGKERRVKVSGELYFDVAQNAQQPFIVESNEVAVEVLGTAFNINCYDNEDDIQATLITGKIKVVPAGGKGNSPGAAKVLAPGQQAILVRKSVTGQEPQISVSDNADMSKVVAWKAGLFNFEGANLYSVMRQLERWYDIKVRYVGQVENVKFKGKMYRNINLSNVLEVLDIMEVKYELKEDVLYVK
jgi:ferric-dicitrate binding protein FerR (iron transport regulator)